MHALALCFTMIVCTLELVSASRISQGKKLRFYLFLLMISCALGIWKGRTTYGGHISMLTSQFINLPHQEKIFKKKHSSLQIFSSGFKFPPITHTNFKGSKVLKQFHFSSTVPGIFFLHFQ